MSTTPYLVPHSQEPIDILHRDGHLLLVRKPHLLLSVPGKHPLNKDCLVTRLQVDYPSARTVHRLDLDTSGIMVLALTRRAESGLGRLFQERRVEKDYLAVVDGIVADDAGEIDLPLAPDWERRPRQKVCHSEGRAALTRYRVLAREGDRTRLLLSPVTGRSHQLRLHLAAVGHPIIGCDLYAPPAVEARSPRLLLHASRLAFPHPVSGAWLERRCPATF
ncbi:pseudouridine synthase [Pseudohaliea rubra]|uniref:Dual-specificity RNA pseudouridine synthase RluA n=1 Tax=Pseudohaliea rubra DSM 19751 TaxID=1265313 RepID=A0A095XZZ1_9GAMM|nr:pseudouridine synthase [Pseudohaliea rubra]KGE05351.1 Ribosomal large subunit pseudouridine synthase A [Pseudohaliea rubra DSM 19751]